VTQRKDYRERRERRDSHKPFHINKKSNDWIRTGPRKVTLVRKIRERTTKARKNSFWILQGREGIPGSFWMNDIEKTVVGGRWEGGLTDDHLLGKRRVIKLEEGH